MQDKTDTGSQEGNTEKDQSRYGIDRFEGPGYTIGCDLDDRKGDGYRYPRDKKIKFFLSGDAFEREITGSDRVLLRYLL